MITVPIKSKTKLDLEDRSSKNDFVVLIEGGLRILGITGDEKLELIDAQGRLIAKKELNQMPSDSFDWLTFTPRIGWLRIERKGQATICKFAHSN